MERKRCKVVMLPTEDRNSSIWLKDGGLYYDIHGKISRKFIPQYLYFTTNEEIKDGDWGYHPIVKEVKKMSKHDPYICNYTKIIATTDPKLKIITGIVGSGTGEPLPQPSKAFIEKYCKVGGIDEVDVEYVRDMDSMQLNIDSKGEISSWYLKVDSHNTITIHSIKDSWNLKEMKDIKLPEPIKHVMVTFIGSVRVRDKYYDHYEKQEITKRGFFSKSDGYYNGYDVWINTPDGYFSVPPDWKEFNGVLLPNGWGGYRVLPQQVIKWEYCIE